ncbi:hypothetical protein GFY24_19895 [Nocardia sp. SYP-A9097]|uniref:hypothetical protein n=1 Tax=Nocardia sp. SYP-A9097 TaxID=2663237 RepID=UPI00129B934E|nr:hypothetical protein [Nocardia sp. SYP-A9097]MRH89680.1 hypothetical protein [Nocardia sp. SYP-A9097]
MSWDAWALLAILALCVAVIVWLWWGFYCEAHRPDDLLRVEIAGGGHLSIARGTRFRGGRHRARRHRIYWPTVHLTYS